MAQLTLFQAWIPLTDNQPGPSLLSVKKRKAEETAVGVAKLSKLLANTAVDEEEEGDEEGDDKIVHLHGLDLGAETVEALWSDGTYTLQAVGDMLDTPALKVMVLKHVKRVLQAQKAALGPLFGMAASCELSTIRLLGKTIRNRMGSNPRSNGPRAVGILTCPAIPVMEEGWKLAVHAKAAARCHVWSTTGTHSTSVPAWRNEFESSRLGPSRLAYRFETLIALLGVFPLSELMTPHPNPQEDADSMICAPKGYLTEMVPMSRYIALGLGAGLDVYDPAVNWDMVADWGELGIPQGTWGIIVAKRCESESQQYD